jgi:hypothetical protein
MRRGGRVKSQFKTSGRMLAREKQKNEEMKKETAVGVKKNRKTLV